MTSRDRFAGLAAALLASAALLAAAAAAPNPGSIASANMDSTSPTPPIALLGRTL